MNVFQQLFSKCAVTPQRMTSAYSHMVQSHHSVWLQLILIWCSHTTAYDFSLFSYGAVTLQRMTSAYSHMVQSHHSVWLQLILICSHTLIYVRGMFQICWHTLVYVLLCIRGMFQICLRYVTHTLYERCQYAILAFVKACGRWVGF